MLLQFLCKLLVGNTSWLPHLICHSVESVTNIDSEPNIGLRKTDTMTMFVGGSLLHSQGQTRMTQQASCCTTNCATNCTTNKSYSVASSSVSSCNNVANDAAFRVCSPYFRLLNPNLLSSQIDKKTKTDTTKLPTSSWQEDCDPSQLKSKCIRQQPNRIIVTSSFDLSRISYSNISWVDLSSCEQDEESKKILTDFLSRHAVRSKSKKDVQSRLHSRSLSLHLLFHFLSW